MKISTLINKIRRIQGIEENLTHEFQIFIVVYPFLLLFSAVFDFATSGSIPPTHLAHPEEI